MSDFISAMLADADRAADLEAAMPPGKWVHDRYRNENGWWSALIQERTDVPDVDSVIRLLGTVVPNQEKGGDIVEYSVRCRQLVPLLIAHVRALAAENSTLKAWKDSVSTAVKNIPEFHSGNWAGDKEGWGFHFEVVQWLIRYRVALEANLKPFACIADDNPELDAGMAVRPTGFLPYQSGGTELEPTMGTCRQAAVLLATKRA